MKNNFLVSIIVPNYNHEKFLKQRLESIFNQTYENFEIILLDDKSTDDSISILKQYANHPKVAHCAFNKTNTGNTFVQWQKGISLAKGELIWIAETDDYCESNFLEKLVQPFQEDLEVVLTYCQSNRVNENGEVTGNWISHTQDLYPQNIFLTNFIMQGNEFIEQFLICKNVIPNVSAVLIKKDAIDIKQHLELASTFRYCGDWMFYFKLIVNKKVAFISESLNSFRHHSSSVIAKAVQSENRIRIIDIDLQMRVVLMNYLLKQNIINFDNIRKNNNAIKSQYVYESALLHIRNDNKLRGYLLLLTVLNVFFDKYDIRNSIKIKICKFLKIY